MTNRSSLKINGTLVILPWTPGLLTSVMALATLWKPSVQKWSLYGKKVRSCENRGRKV